MKEFTKNFLVHTGVPLFLSGLVSFSIFIIPYFIFGIWGLLGSLALFWFIVLFLYTRGGEK